MDSMRIEKDGVQTTDRDGLGRSWVGLKTFIKHNLPLIGVGRKALLKEYQFEMPDVASGQTWPHMKLMGLHDVTWRMNRIRMRYKRYGDRKDAFKQILSMSHENSDRIIASFLETGVVLSAYAYRDGYGPATVTPHPDGYDLGEFICEVPYDTPVRVFVYRMSHVTLYEVTVEGKDPVSVYLEASKRPSFFQMVSSSHADNGPSSPGATVEMNWREKHFW